MYNRNCPLCNKDLNYKSKSNFQRAERNSTICRNCSQSEQKKNVNYSDRNEKISKSRKEYFKNIDEDEHNRQISKFSEGIKKTYLNKSTEWKEQWRKTCSETSKKKWSDDSYKKRVSDKMKINNWSKRADKDEIIEKTLLKKIEKYGKSHISGRCKSFLINGLICDGTHEKFYIEWLLSESKVLPSNTNAIKTHIGYYEPDFEYDDCLVDIKSIFTLRVLLGFDSYSRTKKSNPKQLLKIKYISENIKPIRIILVDILQNKLINLSVDYVLKLKESEVNKEIFKI